MQTSEYKFENTNTRIIFSSLSNVNIIINLIYEHEFILLNYIELTQNQVKYQINNLFI